MMYMPYECVDGVNWQDPVTDHPLNRGLVAWYLAGANQTGWGGVYWRDIVGHNHGTLTSMDPKTDWVGDRPNGGWGGLDFDGSNDNVVISHSAAFNAYPIAVECVFKIPNGSTDTGSLVNKYVAASSNGYHIWVSGGTIYAWYFADGSNNTFQNPDGQSGGSVNDGRWHHALYAVGEAGGKLYIDGVLKSTKAWTGTPAACSNSESLVFGRYQGTSLYLLCQLACVSVRSRSLSDTEAHALYQQSLYYYPDLLRRHKMPLAYAEQAAGGTGQTHLLAPAGVNPAGGTGTIWKIGP